MKIALFLLAAGLGALPFNVLSLQAFIGLYTAVGVLALAAQDYRRSGSRRRRLVRRPAARQAESATGAADLAHTWGCQTMSA